MSNQINEQENNQENVVIDDLFLVNYIWHFKVDDGLGWDFCAELLKDYIQISPQELKERFQNYFEETMGIKPYIKCPKCGRGELVPRTSRRGRYGVGRRFIGCSAYFDSNCDFLASSNKPYKKSRN